MQDTGFTHVLPIEVTSFVGRRAERQQIRVLLNDARLVTLTGFGGVGKTRLAVRVPTCGAHFPTASPSSRWQLKPTPNWSPRASSLHWASRAGRPAL
jgi:hypothetical protein